MSERLAVTSDEIASLLDGRTIVDAELLIGEGDPTGSLILRLSGDLTLYCDSPTLYRPAELEILPPRLHTNHHRDS